MGRRHNGSCVLHIPAWRIRATRTPALYPKLLSRPLSSTQPTIRCTSTHPFHCPGKAKGSKLKGEETAVIDQVAVVGAGKEKGLKQATIKLRFNRNPMIGEYSAGQGCRARAAVPCAAASGQHWG